MTEVPPNNQQVPLDGATPDETEQSDRTRPVRQPAARLPGARAAAGRPPAPNANRQAPQRRSTRQPPRSYAGRAGAARVPAAVPPAQPSPNVPSLSMPSQSGLYLPWWSLVVMVAVVGGLAFGLVLMFDEFSEPQTLGDQAPRIQVITSQPTLSQDFVDSGGSNPNQPQFWPTAIPQFQPEATVPLPTPQPSPSLPPGDFAIGGRVSVVGVGASGLNVRSAPGYAGTPLFLAYEDDVFALVDGPQNADGLEWWKLEDPNDPSRVGWAARNYLTTR